MLQCLTTIGTHLQPFTYFKHRTADPAWHTQAGAQAAQLAQQLAQFAKQAEDFAAAHEFDNASAVQHAQTHIDLKRGLSTFVPDQVIEKFPQFMSKKTIGKLTDALPPVRIVAFLSALPSPPPPSHQLFF